MIFTIQGEPVAKGRPRVTRYGTFTPVKTVNYENLVKLSYIEQCGIKHDGMLVMELKAYFTIPKSASKKKHMQMENGDLRPVKRPDMDNIIKAVSDALNTIAYNDDSQIVKIVAEKYYSDTPRVEVSFEVI